MKSKPNTTRAASFKRRAVILASLLVLSLAISGGGSLATQEEYFAAFQRIAATSGYHWPILHPLLVETNNTALKTTNVECSFERLKTQAEVGRVRLGMTMEEVVSAWGKPILIWKWCGGGGPRFNYSGAKVIWAGTNNCARMIFVFGDGLGGIRFDRGLTAQSNIDEWIRVAGQPTRRSKDGIDWIAYDLPQATVTLTFKSKDRGLAFLLIEKPGGRGFAEP